MSEGGDEGAGRGSGGVTTAAAQVGDRTPGGQTRPAKVASPGGNWVYIWLLVVPMLGVPWLAMNTFSLPGNASFGRWSAAVLTPALLFLPLLIGLGDADLFRRRHAQQALLLAGLRVGSAWFWLAATRGGACGVFIMTNFVLWLGGSLFGIYQVRRGDCWMMSVRGERALLPSAAVGPARAADTGPALNVVAAPQREAVEKPRRETGSAPAAREAAVPARASRDLARKSPAPETGELEAQLARAIKLAHAGRRVPAVAGLLQVYRHGTAPLRRRAQAELERLEEIEAF